MRKSCGHWAVGLVGNQSVRWSLMAVAASWAPTFSGHVAFNGHAGDCLGSGVTSCFYFGRTRRLTPEMGLMRVLMARMAQGRGDSSESCSDLYFPRFGAGCRRGGRDRGVVVLFARVAGPLDGTALSRNGRHPSRLDAMNIPKLAGPAQVQRGLPHARGGFILSGIGCLPVALRVAGGNGSTAQRAHGAGQRRHDHGDGTSHYLPGHRGDAGADDRAAVGDSFSG